MSAGTPNFSFYYTKRAKRKRRRKITAIVLVVLAAVLLAAVIIFGATVNDSLALLLMGVAILWWLAVLLIVRGVGNLSEKRSVGGSVIRFIIAVILLAVGGFLGSLVIRDIPYVNSPELVTVLNASVDRRQECHTDDNGHRTCEWVYRLHGTDANTGESATYGIDESDYNQCQRVSGTVTATVPILPNTGMTVGTVTCRPAE